MKKWLVHAVFECACGWSCQDYLTAQRKAAEHAKKPGHKVSGDLGYAVTYEGRPRGRKGKPG